MYTRGSTYTIQEQLQIHAPSLELGDTEELIIEERAEEIKNLHQDIQGLHDMFQIMRVMIDEQGEQVDQIQTNVQETLKNTEQAVVEIKKANKTQQEGCCQLI